MLVSCCRNNMPFVAIKMGRRRGARSGACLNRYVTDEQGGRRPIFIATLRAAAGWLFFRVARSLPIDLDMLVVTASPARTALKSSELIRSRPDEWHAISATGH
jgi:hypothetical protein